MFLNAWLLYRMDCTALNQKYIHLKRFRLEVAMGLSRCGKETRRDRPSCDIGVPIIHRLVAERSNSASRTEIYANMIIHINNGRCRHCVKGTSRLKCEKYDARLCQTDWHVKLFRSLSYEKKNYTVLKSMKNKLIWLLIYPVYGYTWVVMLIKRSL